MHFNSLCAYKYLHTSSLATNHPRLDIFMNILSIKNHAFIHKKSSWLQVTQKKKNTKNIIFFHTWAFHQTLGGHALGCGFF